MLQLVEYGRHGVMVLPVVPRAKSNDVGINWIGDVERGIRLGTSRRWMIKVQLL